MKNVYIAQGEEAISADEDVVISTVLGSCVSVCLWDPEARVGGMNHLLLPELASGPGGVDSAGAIAMERLINRMVKKGAERQRLRAKVFGGASMLAGLTDIGARNAAFAEAYLKLESIPCDAASTGGTSARRVKFTPVTGQARQKYVKEAPVLEPATTIVQHEVELF